MTRTQGRSSRQPSAPVPAAETVSSIFIPETLALGIASNVCEALRAAVVTLLRLDEGRLLEVASWGAGQAAAAGEADVASIEAGPLEAGIPAWIDPATGNAVAVVGSGGEVFAVVVVRPGPGRPLMNADLEMLDRLADLAGLALAESVAVAQERRRSERLAEMERTKSQFLNLASHELRGPMTVLMGYLSLLEDGAFGPLPDEFAALFPVVNARLAEMEGLINAMLETARLEEDRLELNVERIDLREVVDEALSRSEIFAQDGQRISLRCPDRPIWVRVDRGRTGVVVANLLVNALKYSVNRTDVRCVVSADAMSSLVVVEDDGVGIAAEDLSALFTRFGRIRRDPATSGIPGTGLGLYLARELARAHGGDIAVASEPGKGSAFTLSLPLAD